MALKGWVKSRPLIRRVILIHEAITSDRVGINGRFLAEHLDVSRKTIVRDLDFMRDELKAPIEFSRQVLSYYYAKPYRLPFSPFSAEDAITLALAARALERRGQKGLAERVDACFQRFEKFVPARARFEARQARGAP